MTLEEYMDPERFPLTTQDGLKPKEQFLIDAFNLDQLREYRDDGNTLTERNLQVLAELEVKEKARAELMPELSESDCG